MRPYCYATRMENRNKVSNGTIFSDLQRLNHRATSLLQLSYLLTYVCCLRNFESKKVLENVVIN